MTRLHEISTLLHASRLLQQFIVDGYTMIESQRLLWVRTHQKELRVDLYQGLADAVLSGETNGATIGKRIILPSSFTGGSRYMIQNYQDAMAICRSEDIYTIEFQKRGLPHAHILLFLYPNDKIKDPEAINNFICAEIPDKNISPLMYKLVRQFMLHGPCGRSNIKAPCMKNQKCSKYFPKKFNENTTIDEDGYPTYRRRDDGRTIKVKGIPLDNRYVVPYNPLLLQKFHAHINIEKCNHSTAIKYLFKYISKGNDRVVAAIFDGATNEHNACFARGLLDDDQEYISTIKEASVWASGNSLRKLFVSMLLCFSLHRLDFVWKETSKLLSEDALYIHRNDPMSSTVNISEYEKELVALQEIDSLLRKNGKSLLDFPTMPLLEELPPIDVSNQLILQELNYDKHALQNMRLDSSASRTDRDKLVWFSRWLLDVGDGKIGDSHDGVEEIEIPGDLLISGYQDPIRGIVESTYINLLENLNSNEYFKDKAKPTPTIEMTNSINEHMCDMLPGEPYEFSLVTRFVSQVKIVIVLTTYIP
ncbi:hypothetical protein K1719_047560 [Acacia pycnantha]|nr:hypothetical protein K1719_047560 [Acacia pycnantha]